MKYALLCFVVVWKMMFYQRPSGHITGLGGVIRLPLAINNLEENDSETKESKA